MQSIGQPCRLRSGASAALVLALTILAPPRTAAAQPGSLDPSFGAGGRRVVYFDYGETKIDHCHDVAVTLDGKTVAVGYVYRAGIDTDFGIIRLDASGALDTSFSGDGKTTVAFDLGQGLGDRARAVAIQGDGKILVGGTADTAVSGGTDFAVARLNADGTLDTSFGDDGKVTVPFDLAGAGSEDRLLDLAVQGDGSIVLAGYATASASGSDTDCAVARLLPDGTLDSSFDGDGKVVFDFGLGGVLFDACVASAIQPDGKIVLAGYAGNSAFQRWGVARLSSNGTLDSSFDGDGKATIAVDTFDLAEDLAIQGDGRIVIVGDSAGLSGSPDIGVARLLPDGSLDPSFDGDGTMKINFGPLPTTDYPSRVVVQANGKIVIGGTSFLGPVGTGGTDFIVLRLLGDGSFDPSFDGDGKAVVAFDLGQLNQDWAFSLALRLDGRILVAGSVERATKPDEDFAFVQLIGDAPFSF
jgi:uncharacterized delta-60 repeat protein